MSHLLLSALYVYPIKSAAGIAVTTATVESRGLQCDRRWMVVDAQQRFMTQRQHPRMALIQVAIGPDALTVTAPDMPPLSVPLNLEVEQGNFPAETCPDRLQVEVWGDWCEGIPVGNESRAWFSEFLQIDCQLVYMPDDAHRPAGHGQHGQEHAVSFADGYPFLLISQASLDDLNQRLVEPVPMNRFRPNLVVTGCEAFAEDRWHTFQIGSVPFQAAKPCSRCVIPTIDQTTGDRGHEPLKTLATYRRWDSQIWFGQNLIQKGVGVLTVGDRVTLFPH
ncbi:MAG: MOSC N-terminal beta barrel domain-containing protein [Synechococcales bacterium]|nr:MOSC N-terminal beta barrel domain-containing protein [Synechococcales bacterium]